MTIDDVRNAVLSGAIKSPNRSGSSSVAGLDRAMSVYAGKPLRAHRRLRHHRRPAHRRAGGHERVDRLPLPPVVRLAVGLCRASRCRTRRPLPDRAAARRRGTATALPARHQRTAHPVSLRQRRRRGVRLHARGGRRRRPQRRTSGEDGARRDPFRDAVRSAVRLRARHAHGRAAQRHGDPVRRPLRRARAGAAAARLGPDAGRGRERPLPSSRSAPTSRPGSSSRW